VPCGGLAIDRSHAWNYTGNNVWDWLPLTTTTTTPVTEIDEEAHGIGFFESKGRYCVSYQDLQGDGDACTADEDHNFPGKDGGLCLDLDGCKSHCGDDDSCVAFSHVSIGSYDRCYIHQAAHGCVEDLASGRLTHEERFTFWVKRETKPFLKKTTITTVETITEINTVIAPDARRRLATLPLASTLTFPNLMMNKAGHYKICACDHTLATYERCGSILDFTVQVGRLSVGDRSCALMPTYFDARQRLAQASTLEVWSPDGNCLEMGDHAQVCGAYFTTAT